MTVAPLTAMVLAGADDRNAGIASGLNIAIAHVGGLVAIAAVGAAAAAQFASKLDEGLDGLVRRPQLAAAIEAAKREPLGRVSAPPAPAPVRARLSPAGEKAATSAFHLGMGLTAGLVALGGALGDSGSRTRLARCGARAAPVNSWGIPTRRRTRRPATGTWSKRASLRQEATLEENELPRAGGCRSMRRRGSGYCRRPLARLAPYGPCSARLLAIGALQPRPERWAKAVGRGPLAEREVVASEHLDAGP
jgi:hypothetical protein